MRPRALAGLVVALLLGPGLSGPARAALIGTYTFDEKGKASWSGANQPPAGVKIMGGGLTYDIGVTGTTFAANLQGKYIRFNESDTDTTISDVIKIATATKFEYFSDTPEKGEAKDPADSDTALATRFMGVAFFATRSERNGANEGSNSITFTLTDNFGDDVKFVGISDTPEPSTLVMTAVGASCLCGHGWLRRRRRAAGARPRA